MFSTGKRIGLAACLFSVAVLALGCNVEGFSKSHDRWAQSGADRPAAGARPAKDAGGVDMSIVGTREVDLVEGMVNHRTQYHRLLRQLQEYYTAHGYPDKAKWAAFELEGLGKVQTFRYLLDAEVASDSLRPTDSIPEADAVYAKGLDLMRRGGYGVPGIYRRDRMIEAARTFRSLIEQYPTSDKIDDAAFFCGEIHKEYLPGQEGIAVRWYERAIAWNPDTPHPARFQAAVIYDYRLHDRDRALELYQAAIQKEPTHESNARFAGRRIHELTGNVQPVTASPVTTPPG